MFTTKKTLDGILAGFRKTVDDLSAFSAAKAEESEAAHLRSMKAAAEADDAHGDATRATEIAKKIAALIEG